MQNFDFEALNRKPQDNNQRMVHYQQLFNEVKEKILNIRRENSNCILMFFLSKSANKNRELLSG